MLFKELRAGQTVHMLNRMTAECKTGTVEENPSGPHYVPTQPTMMVDVTISTDGIRRTYTIPENLSVTYAEQWCICTDQADMKRELEGMQAALQKHISETPGKEKLLEKVKEKLLELNPQAKREQEYEDRLARLETGMNDIATMLKKMNGEKSE